MIGFYNYTVILTYAGTVAAVVGIISAIGGNTFTAVICLIIAGVCDMFDGSVAKTRKRTSPERSFGVWIDSLSDLICFGVLPAVIGYSIGLDRVYYYFVMAVYVLAALIRLAYFGVTEIERQTSGGGDRVTYDGLPVTTAALIFPLLYCFKNLLGSFFAPVYAFILACTALAFVLRFKVKKLEKRGILAIFILGFLIFICVIAVKSRII